MKLSTEDINGKGMFQNRKLAKALSDAAFGQFGRILTYMAEDAGIEVVKAGRFFASSKLCACSSRTSLTATANELILNE